MSGSTEPRAGAAAASTQAKFAATVKRAVVNMLVRREDKDCHPQPNVNLCNKPWAAGNEVTWIVVGVVLGIFLLATGSIITFFHFKRRKREKREDEEDKFHRADYGLDELPAAGRPRPDDDVKSHDGSPSGYGRRSRDPLQVGAEPKYPATGHLNGHLNPFDDGSSSRSGNGSPLAPTVNPAWPKRESSQLKPTAQDS